MHTPCTTTLFEPTSLERRFSSHFSLVLGWGGKNPKFYLASHDD